MSQSTTVPPVSNPGQTADPATRALRPRRRKESGGHGEEAGAPAPLWAKIVITVLCLGWILPVFGLAVTSLRDRTDAASSGWWTIFTSPSQLSRLTVQNYVEVFERAPMAQAFVNSLAISIPATIIPILIAAFAAYAFTFMEFPLRNFLLVVVVALLVVPNQVAFAPILNIYGQLGLNGQFVAVWGAHIGFGMSLAIYLIRNYMATLPREILESAKIDGASHFQTFWKLIIPMSVPALASFAIFQFLWVWNDLLVALIFIGPGDNAPLTLALNSLLGQQGQGDQLLTAGAFFTMILPIIVFLSLQRYFVRGLTAGSVKG
ncbi:alpha-glucoside transport system permease protein [Quadrisphaera granulorum]|uniref:Alpha-glucoside transport system permease protein n=1 Tax=Quadrisphaera granulorum TaxID=317664 RepID=A0A316ABP4_9ACTN|nr:carbohydrate ABC transporter permease [Quadrisphaera granulorum]PWJ54678.1 alpha-glucoside transport system permease protein [Quadrisphaera granulorum]SZE96040.1 alpha-glucoside transport system permease protein [Quadrisphaera granulorum]